MSESLDQLVTQLEELLTDLVHAETEHADSLAAVSPVHRRGAVNLVHYAVLRRHDRRELQRDLMDLGATSLATAEADVRAKVLAARNVLCALRGDPGPWDLEAIREALDQGDQIRTDNADAMFGPMRPGRPTRVMVTLPGEAADDPDLVADLVHAGMDIVRINCAHDDPSAWARMATSVRAAAASAKRHVRVSMDLPGPKLRTGPIVDGPRVGRARVTRLESGEVLAPATIWFTNEHNPGTAPPPLGPAAKRPALHVVVDPDWLSARRVGDVIAMRDARGPGRSFRVTGLAPGAVIAEGWQNTYVTEGDKVSCNGDLSTVAGVPALPRTLALAVGDRLALVGDMTPVEPPAPGQMARIGCTLPGALAAMRPGQSVVIDDGKIAAVVEQAGLEEAVLRVVRTKPGGQRLGAEKGINLPDTVLPVTALTPDDETHLPFITQHADIVAVSFIRTPADVTHLLERLEAAGANDLGLVLKIETRQGFENLPDILLAAMRHQRVAVMIARGDLAVEIGFERLAEVPRQTSQVLESQAAVVVWCAQAVSSS